MMDAEPATDYLPILRVGLPLQLTVESGTGKVQCSATLLGWKDGAWLLCEWPLQSGQAVHCEVGARCLVQYLLAGKLIGYESEVRSVQTDPTPLLYLAFPQAVEEMQLRKNVRVPSNEPLFLIRVDGKGARCVDANGDSTMGGLVQDLSVAGCRVVLQRAQLNVQQGSTVHLEFELVGIGHVSNLTGVIKSVAEQGNMKSLGIEFRFGRKECIEYRGWGGSVQKAIESAVLQKQHVPGLAPGP